MLEAFAIYAWYQEGEGREHVATFVTSESVPDAHGRAHEVMRRLSSEGKGDSFSVEKLDINLSNEMLGLRPMLSEVKHSDFVDAAFVELHENGEMFVPLWANPAWLVHEVRARYDIGIDFVGRKMTVVSRDEMERRVNEGIEPERRRSPQVVTEDEDAGFQETL